MNYMNCEQCKHHRLRYKINISHSILTNAHNENLNHGKCEHRLQESSQEDGSAEELSAEGNAHMCTHTNPNQTKTP